MARIRIPVHCLEFEDGGDTIWVQSERGTVLRLKFFKNRIEARECGDGEGPGFDTASSHMDVAVMTDHPAVMCLSSDAERE